MCIIIAQAPSRITKISCKEGLNLFQSISGLVLQNSYIALKATAAQRLSTCHECGLE
jgi:hypothetical protein